MAGTSKNQQNLVYIYIHYSNNYIHFVLGDHTFFCFIALNISIICKLIFWWLPLCLPYGRYYCFTTIDDATMSPYLSETAIVDINFEN